MMSKILLKTQKTWGQLAHKLRILRIKRLFSLTVILPLFLVLVSFWAGRGVFKYSIFSTHDGNHHIARSFDAVQTFKEGHFPLRWAGSLNYHCGVAIYNFFYPLIYYLVILINFFTHNIIRSLKIIYFNTFWIGTLFFYLWLNQEVKNKLAAFAGAFLYLFAPYRFLLIFVRGSPEFLAYTLLPISLFFYSLCFNTGENRKFVVFLFLATLFGGLLTVAHNFVAMFAAPILLVYLLVKLSQLKPLELKKVGLVLFSFVSIFGLGAFFTGPALIEKRYVNIGKLKTVDFRQHFPTLWQLIRSKWGYFYSSPGVKNDGMSFELGYAHWLVLGLVGMFLLLTLYQNRQKIRTGFLSKNIWVLLWFTLALGTIFLILPWSLFIWERVKLLQQIQFSWRLLGISVFFISALFAFFLVRIKRRTIFWAIFLPVVFLAFYGNRNHLLPQPVSVKDVYRYKDFENLHPHRYSTTTLGDDVLSIGAKKHCWFGMPMIAYEDGSRVDYSLIERGNTYGEVKFNLDPATKARAIRLDLEYFPGIYRFQVNGLSEVSYFNCKGRVCLYRNALNEGDNYLSWRIYQSPTENFFNWVSLVFLFVWIALLVWVFAVGRWHCSRKWSLAFLSILVLFLFFRLYHLPQRAIFNWDQERDARIVAEMISLKKPVLIGPRVFGPGGFFLPPWFFYLLIPFYLGTNFAPAAIYWFIAVYGLIFFVTSYWVISRVFGKLTALLFLFFWAWHPYAVAIDTIAWNPVLIPLLFVILLYLVFQSQEKKKSFLPIFLTGLAFGLGVSFHVQFLLLSPILLVSLFTFKEKSQWAKNIGYLLVGFILPFAPLLVFDLRHNMLNSRLIGSFISSGGNKDLFAFWPVWNNVVAEILGFKAGSLTSGLFFVFMGLLFFYLVKIFQQEKTKSLIWKSMGLVWLLSPLFFSFYGKRPSEYYFNYLFPITVLAFASLFAFWFEKRNVAKTSIACFLLIAIYLHFIAGTVSLLRANPTSLFYKDQSIKFIAKVTNNRQRFNLSFSVPLGADSGFRYLLNYYQIKPTGNSLDPLFRLVIPPAGKERLFIFGGIGVYIPNGWMEDNWL
jgi:hypothetical protein